MSLSRSRMVLVALLGFALLTNGVWLVPDEGDPRYTYERTAVTVTEGAISYEGVDTFEQHNDLQAVGCEQVDAGGRGCAFEAYLADSGPVNVSRAGYDHLQEPDEEFVELEGEYYRRTRQSLGEGRLSYDVAAVDAATVLSAIDRDVDSEGGSLGARVATSGTETTTAPPDSVRGVGSVYEVEGDYYVVVVAEQAPVDRVPVPLPRLLLSGVGGLLLAGVGYRLAREGVAWVREEGVEGLRERL